MTKNKFDTLKIEINWPIYLYVVFCCISAVYNFTSVLKYQDNDVHLGAFNFNMWLCIIFYVYYWVKIQGYTKFREGAPLLPFFINRVVFVALNTLVFKSMTINWKVVIIGFFLEIVISLLYIIDINLYEYIEEDIELSNDVGS